MISSPGAAATPASSGATGGACQLPDASRLATGEVRPPRKSSPPDLPQTAGCPWSGWEAARSDLPGQGIGGARFPTRDQRHSWYRGEQPQGAH